MKKLFSLIASLILLSPFIASAQQNLVQGGTGLSSYTAGDLLYATSNTLRFSKLNLGAAGTCLTSSGTLPQWTTCASGDSKWATSTTQTRTISPAGALAVVLGGTATSSMNEQFGLLGAGNPGTNSTGLYIAPKTAGTNNWNIYSGDAATANNDPVGAASGASHIFLFDGSNKYSTAVISAHNGLNSDNGSFYIEESSYGTNNITALNGFIGNIFHKSSGTLGSAFGMYSMIDGTGGGQITDSYGLFLDSAAGNIVNNYGLKIEDQTSGTKNFAIKTGLGLNDLGDSLLVRASTTLQNFTAQNSTSTNATTTNLFATTASTSAFYFSNATGTQTRLADGSNTLPALSFSADPDTGIYRGGTNTLSLAAGATSASLNTSAFRPNVDASLDLGSSAQRWANLWLSGNSTTTNATTTAFNTSTFTLTGATTGCATFTDTGLSSTGVACGSGSGGAAYPFPLTGNATSTLTQFNGGLTAYSSTSTINNLTMINSSTTNATTTSLHIGTGSTFNGLNANSANSLDFWSNGTWRGGFSSNGNFGIGSTTPWTTLSVDRSANASSSIAVAEYRYGTGSNLATSTTATIDCRTANTIHWPLGTSATTLTVSGMIPGQTCKIIIENPNAASGALTWAAASGSLLLWANGSVPTQTTTANKMEVWSFLGTQGSSTPVILGTLTPNF